MRLLALSSLINVCDQNKSTRPVVLGGTLFKYTISYTLSVTLSHLHSPSLTPHFTYLHSPSLSPALSPSLLGDVKLEPGYGASRGEDMMEIIKVVYHTTLSTHTLLPIHPTLSTHPPINALLEAKT